MVDVLLINPPNAYKKFLDIPPLGLTSIASHLKRNQISVKIIDLEIENYKTKSIIIKYSPRIVCIGGTTETRFESFRIAKEVKELDKDIVVLYGGPHASSVPDDTLKHNPPIDFVVRGEAEESVYELTSHFLEDNTKLKDIRGVSYRKSGEIINLPCRNRAKELDRFRVDYSLLDMNRYNLKLDFINKKTVCIVTSRGCPMNCAFCSASQIWGHKVTRRTAKSVVDEIEFLISKYGYEGVKFFDATFTYNKKSVTNLCDEIKKRQLKILWECESRVDVMSKKLLTMMKSAGCFMVDFGLESASQRVLQRIKKRISVDQALLAIRNMNSLKLYSKMFFIYGLPDETFQDALMTFKFIKRNTHLINKISANICTIYPATEVERFAISRGYLPKAFSWSGRFYQPSYVRDFDANPNVPKLIQPSLNYSQLKQLFAETYKERFSWSLIKRKLSDIGTDKGIIYCLKEASKSLLFYRKNYKRIFNNHETS